MSTPDTEREEPITLRASLQLGRRPVERAAAARAAPAPPGPQVTKARTPTAPSGASALETSLETIALAMGGVALLSSLGWMMERRERLRQPIAPDSTRPAALAAPQTAPVALAAAMAALAPPQRRGVRRSHGPRSLGKKLVKLLFVIRSFAGASAVLAAIAMVVFWSIEFVDPGGDEPKLDMALGAVLLAGWFGFWVCGRLANKVHRSLFGRDHPRFAE